MGAAAAAGITAVAGIAGSAMQSGAVSGGKGEANAAQQQALAQQRADLAPWAGSGGLANTRSADLLGLNGPAAADAAFAGYRTSPGYGFQMSEGLRAVDAGAAAKGLLRSGATLKAEQNFGAGLADSDFQQYYQNLFGMSKLGESAAAGQGAGSIVTGQGIANTDIGAAGAQASIFGNAKGLGNSANALFGGGGGGLTNSLFGGAGSAYTYSDPLNSNS